MDLCYFSGESNKTQRFSAIKLLGQKTDNVERLEQGIKQAVLLVFPHEDNLTCIINSEFYREDTSASLGNI